MNTPYAAPTRVSLPTELVQQVINYLMTRPFGEVAPMIAEIQQKHEPVTEKPEEEKK